MEQTIWVLLLDRKNLGVKLDIRTKIKAFVFLIHPLTML